MDRSSQPKYKGWVAVKVPYDAACPAGTKFRVRSKLCDVLVNGKFYTTVCDQELVLDISNEPSVVRIQPYRETYVLHGPAPTKSPPIRFRMWTGVSGTAGVGQAIDVNHFQFRDADADRVADSEPVLMDRLVFTRHPQIAEGTAVFARGPGPFAVPTLLTPFDQDHYMIVVHSYFLDWDQILGDQAALYYILSYLDPAGVQQAEVRIPAAYFYKLAVAGFFMFHTFSIGLEFIRPIQEINWTSQSGANLPAMQLDWQKFPMEQVSYGCFEDYIPSRKQTPPTSGRR